jgi:hypothetical protein
MVKCQENQSKWSPLKEQILKWNVDGSTIGKPGLEVYFEIIKGLCWECFQFLWGLKNEMKPN